MVKNKALPDSAAHPSLRSLTLFLSLCLSLSPTPFILRVPLESAEAGPWQYMTPRFICPGPACKNPEIRCFKTAYSATLLPGSQRPTGFYGKQGAFHKILMGHRKQFLRPN